MSVDTEKASDKIQHPFNDRKSQQTGWRRHVPQHNKGHIRKSTAHNILNGEKLTAFHLRSGTSHGVLSPLLFSLYC